MAEVPQRKEQRRKEKRSKVKETRPELEESEGEEKEGEDNSSVGFDDPFFQHDITTATAVSSGNSC